MSTTAIFAELLVAGIHALIWVTLLLLSFTGTKYVQPANLATMKDWSAVIAIAVVGLCYAVGVVVDRIADSRLRFIDVRFRKSVFGAEEFPIGRTRMIAAFKSSELAAYLGYIRSRMRVARALCFNSFFLTISTALFLVTQTIAGWRGVAAAIVLGLTLCGAALFAWWRISITFYTRLRQARAILLNDPEVAKLFAVPAQATP